MTKDIFADRKKALEDEYFRKKESELIEKLRRRAEDESRRQALADATGIADEEILNDLQELGFTRDTIELLHFVPLVQTAWASGVVTPEEKELVLELTGFRSIFQNINAYRQLLEWLDTKPSNDFFQKTLQIIQDILQALPKVEREAQATDLVEYCTRIAQASGGILGFGNKMSSGEREVLEKIAAALESKRRS